MTPAPGFHLTGASVRNGPRQLLAPADLHLPPGRICGVIGRNGAGKSTLLRLLARALPPASGTVTLDGDNITALAERSFARKVAHMPQSAPPADSMVLRDLVALGRYPWHGAFGRMRPEDEAAVDAALQRLDLVELAHRRLGELSGGERQRARLALMLAQGAGWLILDEPSAALDLAWAQEMLTHLRGLAQAGKGVIIALHDMNLAARFCDDLLAIRDGMVIAHGAVADVFRPDILSDLFGLPIRVVEIEGQPVALPQMPG